MHWGYILHWYSTFQLRQPIFLRNTSSHLSWLRTSVQICDLDFYFTKKCMVENTDSHGQ